jgi:MSHA pilin protein MshD
MRAIHTNKGVTLIELLVFIVVMAIAVTAVVGVYSETVRGSNDPLIRLRALELAQAQLDEVLARKFDENTPSGGVPACGSTGGPVCAGILADSDYDDVGDFDGFVDNSHSGYSIQVSVSEAGGDLGLAPAQARLITVTVSAPSLSINPGGSAVSLSAYRVNF